MKKEIDFKLRMSSATFKKVRKLAKEREQTIPDCIVSLVSSEIVRQRAIELDRDLKRLGKLLIMSLSTQNKFLAKVTGGELTSEQDLG